MEEREPVAKEKESTPISMRRIHRSFSCILIAVISP
jgi:hypothetical protein